MSYLITQYLVAAMAITFVIAVLFALQKQHKTRLVLVAGTAFGLTTALASMIVTGQMPASQSLILAEFNKLSPQGRNLVQINLIARQNAGLQDISTAEYLRLIQSAHDSAPVKEAPITVAI